MERQRLVFITSLERSGSTILDLVLGAHPRLVGLGELFRFLSRKPEWVRRGDLDRACSCGHVVADCPYWGPLVNRRLERPDDSVLELYRLAFDVFHDVFGEDIIPVDSSKSFHAMRALLDMGGIDLRVVYLVKDVRAWTVSIADAARRRQEFSFRLALRPNVWRAAPVAFLRERFMRYIPTFTTWEWYLRNWRLRRFMDGNGIRYLEVGYDQLAQNQDEVLPAIYDFIGVDRFTPPDGNYRTKSHVVWGNRVRSQATEPLNIRYDDRWRQRRSWVIPWLLYPHVRAYNRRHVYSGPRVHG